MAGGDKFQLVGVAKADITRRVDETAAMLHLSAILDRRPAEVSGGQRQRVAIGRAIVALHSGEAMTVRQFGQHDHTLGEEVSLGFDPAQVYLFDDQDQAIG